LIKNDEILCELPYFKYDLMGINDNDPDGLENKTAKKT